MIRISIPAEEKSHYIIPEDIQNKLQRHHPKIRFEGNVTRLLDRNNIGTCQHHPTDQNGKKKETKKKIFTNVPVNWELPDGLKMAKDDVISQIIAF